MSVVLVVVMYTNVTIDTGPSRTLYIHQPYNEYSLKTLKESKFNVYHRPQFTLKPLEHTITNPPPYYGHPSHDDHPPPPLLLVAIGFP